MHLRCAERTEYPCHHCELPVPADQKMFARPEDKVYACKACALANSWPAALREQKKAPKAGASGASKKRART